MLNHVTLFDDFCGYSVFANIWNDDYYSGSNSNREITREGVAVDLNGTLTILAGNAEDDCQQVDTQHTNQFRRAKKATFEARFKLDSIEDFRAVFGFTVDNGANVFGLLADHTDGYFHLYSRVGAVTLVDSNFATPVIITKNWFVFKVVCNGEKNSVDVYLDGVLKGTITDANLATGDLTPCIFLEVIDADGIDKKMYVDWVSIHQDRASMVRFVDDIADSNIFCIGEGVDEYLIGMNTAGTDAGEVWSISANYTATSLGKGGGSRCTVVTEFDGDIYAGFNDGQFYKWAGGTSWTSASFNDDPFDAIKWKGELYVSTTESSGRATIKRFDDPGWTDIGSSSWTNESDTSVRMCVHDNKLYAIYLSDNEVFEYVSGTTWTSRGNPGGVTTGTLDQVRSVFSFKGGLYAAAGATNSVIYKWGGGTTWTAVYTAADQLQRPVVCNGQIVVFDRNTTTGEISILTSPDGIRFAEVGSFTPTENGGIATGRARGAVVAGLSLTNAKIWEVR